MPSSGKTNHGTSTSLTISGPMADVGSLEQMTFRLHAQCPAIATTLAVGPARITDQDISVACSGSARGSRKNDIARLFGLTFGHLPNPHRVTRAVSAIPDRCGNRLKCWNTIAPLPGVRGLDLLEVMGQLGAINQLMRPELRSSQRFMQRMRVDLA